MTCTTCTAGVVFAEEVSAGITRCRKCRAEHPDPPAPPPPPALSRIARALEEGFDAIRERHSELPHIVVVVATGAEGRKGVTHWGHFASRRWVFRRPEPGPAIAEIKIAAEGLNRPVAEVLETMLHEAAHALADVRGIRDTSNGARYHNERFAALAREVGLTPPLRPDKRHGYADTAPNEAFLRALYGPLIARLEAALTLYRREEPPRAPTKKAGGGERLTAECGCGRKLRIVASVLAQGPIVCGRCRLPFAAGGVEDPRDVCNECATRGDDCVSHGSGGE